MNQINTSVAPWVMIASSPPESACQSVLAWTGMRAIPSSPQQGGLMGAKKATWWRVQSVAMEPAHGKLESALYA